jgi:lambda repressor-like predicted transcriptional regulator
VRVEIKSTPRQRNVFQSVPIASTAGNAYDNMECMKVNNGGSPATHFGRQMRKERMARGWSLRELSARTGIDFSHLSRVESGKRPPTEKIAAACDRVFPERNHWFTEWYQEFTTWTEVPAGFRDWGELEDKAVRLSVWTPGIVDGLLQTADYARALAVVQPAVTAELVTARVASRIERQRRVLMRDNPARTSFVVDEMALYRAVGSPEVMAEQCARLAEVAVMPHVTVQVLPAVAHPANASAFIVTDSAAWAEHVAGGFAYITEETVNRLAILFDTLRGESFRVSESATMIVKAGELWAHGANPATQMATAGSASK